MSHCHRYSWLGYGQYLLHRGAYGKSSEVWNLQNSQAVELLGIELYSLHAHPSIDFSMNHNRGSIPRGSNPPEPQQGLWISNIISTDAPIFPPSTTVVVRRCTLTQKSHFCLSNGSSHKLTHSRGPIPRLESRSNIGWAGKTTGREYSCAAACVRNSSQGT